MIKIEVQSTRAVIRHQEPLTVGLRGAKVSFTFGQDWNDLIKTAVFRQGEKTVAVTNVEQETVLPWEVMTVPGLPVHIGVYGTDSTGDIAIPTVWAVTSPVHPGTTPEADPSTEPTPGLWEQMQGKLSDLETDLNKVSQQAYVVTVAQVAQDSYRADGDTDRIQRALDEKRTVLCYWYDNDIMLHLADYQSNVSYTFTAVTGAMEYCIVIRESGVITGTVTRLAKESDLPRKISQLENDSGFLTEVPATVATGLKVTVNQNAEGGYFSNCDPDVIEEALENDRRVLCYWQNKDVMLYPTSFQAGGPYIFTTITGTKEYRVVIRDTEDIDCTVTDLAAENASGGGLTYYEELIEIPTTAGAVTVEFPCPFADFVNLDFHLTCGKVETALILYMRQGNSGYKEVGTIPVGDKPGMHLRFVKAIVPDMYSNVPQFWVITSVSSFTQNANLIAGGTLYPAGGNSLTIYIKSGAEAFPEGTKLSVMGVYK